MCWQGDGRFSCSTAPPRSTRGTARGSAGTNQRNASPGGLPWWRHGVRSSGRQGRADVRPASEGHGLTGQIPIEPNESEAKIELPIDDHKLNKPFGKQKAYEDESNGKGKIEETGNNWYKGIN